MEKEAFIETFKNSFIHLGGCILSYGLESSYLKAYLEPC